MTTPSRNYPNRKLDFGSAYSPAELLSPSSTTAKKQTHHQKLAAGDQHQQEMVESPNIVKSANNFMVTQVAAKNYKKNQKLDNRDNGEEFGGGDDDDDDDDNLNNTGEYNDDDNDFEDQKQQQLSSVSISTKHSRNNNTRHRHTTIQQENPEDDEDDSILNEATVGGGSSSSPITTNDHNNQQQQQQHQRVDATRTASIVSMILEDAKDQLFSKCLNDDKIQSILEIQATNAARSVQQAKDKAVEFANYLPTSSSSNNKKNPQSPIQPQSQTTSSFPHQHQSKTSMQAMRSFEIAAAGGSSGDNKTSSSSSSNLFNHRRNQIVSSAAYHLQQKLNQWKFVLPTSASEATRRENEITKTLREFDALARRAVTEGLLGRIKTSSWPFRSQNGFDNHSTVWMERDEEADDFEEMMFRQKSSQQEQQNDDDQHKQKRTYSSSSMRRNKNNLRNNNLRPPQQCKTLIAEGSWNSPASAEYDGLRCVILIQPRFIELWGDVGEVVRAAKEEVKARSHILHNCVSCRRTVQVPLCTVVVVFGIPVFVEADIGLSCKNTIVGGGVFSESIGVTTISTDPNSEEALLFAEQQAQNMKLNSNNNNTTGGSSGFGGNSSSNKSSSSSSSHLQFDSTPPLDSFATRGMTCDEFRSCPAANFILRAISHEFGFAPHRLMKDPILFMNNDCEVHHNPFDLYYYIRNVRRMFCPIVTSVLDTEEDEWVEEMNLKQEQQQQSNHQNNNNNDDIENENKSTNSKKVVVPSNNKSTTSKNNQKQQSSSTTTTQKNNTSNNNTKKIVVDHQQLQQQAKNEEKAVLASRLFEPRFRFRPEFWYSTFRKHPSTFLSSDAFRALTSGSQHSMQVQLQAAAVHDRTGMLASRQLYRSCIGNLVSFLLSEILSSSSSSSSTSSTTTTMLNWTALPLGLVPRIFHAFGVNFSLCGYVLRQVERELLEHFHQQHDQHLKNTSTSNNDNNNNTAKKKKQNTNNRSSKGNNDDKNKNSNNNSEDGFSSSSSSSPPQRLLPFFSLTAINSAVSLTRSSPVCRALRFEMAARCASDILNVTIREILFNNSFTSTTNAPATPAAFSSSQHQQQQNNENYLIYSRIETAAKKFLQMAMSDTLSDVAGEDIQLWKDRIIPRMKSVFDYEPFLFECRSQIPVSSNNSDGTKDKNNLRFVSGHVLTIAALANDEQQQQKTKSSTSKLRSKVSIEQKPKPQQAKNENNDDGDEKPSSVVNESAETKNDDHDQSSSSSSPNQQQQEQRRRSSLALEIINNVNNKNNDSSSLITPYDLHNKRLRQSADLFQAPTASSLSVHSSLLSTTKMKERSTVVRTTGPHTIRRLLTSSSSSSSLFHRHHHHQLLASSRPTPGDFDHSHPTADPVLAAMFMIGSPVSVTNRIDVKPWGRTDLNQTDVLSPSQKNHSHSLTSHHPKSIKDLLKSKMLIGGSGQKQHQHEHEQQQQQGSFGTSQMMSIISSLLPNFVVPTTISFPTAASIAAAAASSATPTTTTTSSSSQQMLSYSFLQKQLHKDSNLNFVHHPLPPSTTSIDDDDQNNSTTTSTPSYYRDPRLDYLFLTSVSAAELKATMDNNFLTSTSPERDRNQQQHQEQQQQEKQKSIAQQIATYFVDSRQDWRFAERLLQLCGIVLREPTLREKQQDALGRYSCTLVPVTCASLLSQEPLLDKVTSSAPSSSSDLNNDNDNNKQQQQDPSQSILSSLQSRIEDDWFKNTIKNQSQFISGKNLVELEQQVVSFRKRQQSSSFSSSPATITTTILSSTTTASNTRNNNNNNNSNNVPVNLSLLEYWFRSIEVARRAGDSSKFRALTRSCIEMLQTEFIGAIADLGTVPLLMSLSQVDADSGALISSLENAVTAVNKSEMSLQGSVFLLQSWENVMDCVRATETVGQHGLLLQQQQHQQQMALQEQQRKEKESKSKFSFAHQKKDKDKDLSAMQVSLSGEFISRLRNETSEKLRVAARSISNATTGATMSASEALEQLSIQVFETSSSSSNNNTSSTSSSSSSLFSSSGNEASSAFIKSAIVRSFPHHESLRYEVFTAVSNLCGLKIEELCPLMYDADLKRVKESWAEVCRAAKTLALQQGALPTRKSAGIFAQLLFRISSFMELIRYKDIFMMISMMNDDTTVEHDHHHQDEKVLIGKQIDKLRSVDTFRRFITWVLRLSRALTRSASLQSPDLSASLATLSQILFGLQTQIRCDIDHLDTLYRRVVSLARGGGGGLDDDDDDGDHHNYHQSGALKSAGNNDQVSSSHRTGGATTTTNPHQFYENRSNAPPRSHHTGGSNRQHHHDGLSSVGTEDSYAPPSILETIRNRGIAWFFGSNNDFVPPAATSFTNSGTAGGGSSYSNPAASLSSLTIGALASSTSSPSGAAGGGGAGGAGNMSMMMSMSEGNGDVPDFSLISNHELLQAQLDRDTILFFRQWSNKLFKDVPELQRSQAFSWDAGLQRTLSDIVCSAHRFSLYPEISLRIAREIIATSIQHVTTVDQIWSLQKRRGEVTEKTVADRCRENAKALNIKLMQHPLRLLRLGMETSPIPFSTLPLLLDVAASLLLCALVPPWREERDRQKLMQMRALYGSTTGFGGFGGGANNNRTSSSSKKTTNMASSLFLKGGQHSRINALRAQHARSTQKHLQEFVQSQVPTHTVWFPHSVQVRNRPAFYLSSTGEYVVTFANNLNYRETLGKLPLQQKQKRRFGRSNDTRRRPASSSACSTLSSSFMSRKLELLNNNNTSSHGAGGITTAAESRLGLLGLSSPTNNNTKRSVSTTTPRRRAVLNASKNDDLDDDDDEEEETNEDMMNNHNTLNPDSACMEQGKDPYSQMFPKTIDIALSGVDRMLTFCEELVFLMHHTVMLNNNNNNSKSSSTQHHHHQLPDRRTNMDGGQLQKWFTNLMEEESGFKFSSVTVAHHQNEKKQQQQQQHNYNNNPDNKSASPSKNADATNSEAFSETSSGIISTSTGANTKMTGKQQQLPPEQQLPSRDNLPKWFMPGTWAQSTIARESLMKSLHELVTSNHETPVPIDNNNKNKNKNNKNNINKNDENNKSSKNENGSNNQEKQDGQEEEEETEEEEEEEKIIKIIAPPKARIELATQIGRILSVITYSVLMPVMAELRLLDELTKHGLRKDARRGAWCEVLNMLTRIVNISETAAASLPIEESVMMHIAATRRDFVLPMHQYQQQQQNTASATSPPATATPNQPPPLYLSAIPKEHFQAYSALLEGTSNKNNNNKNTSHHQQSHHQLLPYPRTWQTILMEADKQKAKSHLYTLAILEQIYLSCNNNNTNNTTDNTTATSSSTNKNNKIPEEAFSFSAGGRVPRFEECYFRLFVSICVAQVGHFELGAMTSNHAGFEARGDVLAKHLNARMAEEAALVQAISQEKKQIIISCQPKRVVAANTNTNTTTAAATTSNTKTEEKNDVESHINTNSNKRKSSPSKHEKQLLAKKKLEQEKSEAAAQQKKNIQTSGFMTISPHVITLPYVALARSSAAGGGGGGESNTQNHSSETHHNQTTTTLRASIKVPTPTVSVSWMLPKTATPTRPTLAVLPSATSSLKEALITVNNFEIRVVSGQTIVPFVVPASMRNRLVVPGEYVFGYFTDSRPDHKPVLTSDTFRVVQAPPPR